MSGLTKQQTGDDMTTKLDEFRNDKGELPAFAWPGGYPLFYLDNEDNVLCPHCANKPGYNSDPVAYDISWEDPNLICDDCGKRIESAYAEDLHAEIEQILSRIADTESAMASAKAHFTDYDQAGQDIEDCEKELNRLRARLEEIESGKG